MPPFTFSLYNVETQRGDRDEQILIDSFVFHEIISPRMHKRNWIPFPSHLPLSSSLLRVRKTLHEPLCLGPASFQKVLQRYQRAVPIYVMQQGLKPETSSSEQNRRAMSGSVLRHVLCIDDIRRKKTPMGSKYHADIYTITLKWEENKKGKQLQ